MNQLSNMAETILITVTSHLYSNVERLQIMIRRLIQNMDHFDQDEELRRLQFLNTNVEQLIELVTNLEDVTFDVNSEEKANRVFCDMLPFMLFKMCCQKGQNKEKNKNINN